MSVRLNNDAREKIIKAALEKSGFPARIKEKKVEHNNARWACLVASFGGLKAYRRILDRVKTIDEKTKALIDDDVFIKSTIGYNEWRHYRLNLGGMTVSYPEKTTEGEYAGLRRLSHPNNAATLAADHPAVDAFLKVEKDINDLDSSKRTLEEQIRAVVYSVNSTKRLVEVWPEAAELIPSDIEVQRAALPAINFGSLNAAIGIPSAKKE